MHLKQVETVLISKKLIQIRIQSKFMNGTHHSEKKWKADNIHTFTAEIRGKENRWEQTQMSAMVFMQWCLHGTSSNCIHIYSISDVRIYLTYMCVSVYVHLYVCTVNICKNCRSKCFLDGSISILYCPLKPETKILLNAAHQMARVPR